MKAACALVLLVGVLLRLSACAAHDAPRGDVVLDVGVARSLAEGAGFASGFERAVQRALGDEAPPPDGHADQHPPLWPALGALLAVTALEPFVALKLLSFAAGLLLVVIVLRLADRLVEDLPTVPDGVPLLAAALVGASFLLVDAAGNGSLYALQAAGVLLLVERLAALRPALLGAGVVLGGLLLLNHQMLVLLPLPLLVLALAPPDGAGGRSRARALVQGALVCAVALALQLPWWLRNDALFDNPLHSVNGLYLHYWAGGAVTFAVEQGQAVQRVTPVGGATLARALLGFLRMNALYLFMAGLVLLPGLLGPALASVPGAARRALRCGDRRVLGLLLAGAALGAVTLLWPAAKLRYLVTLVPIVVLLGCSALVRRPGPLERVAACAVLLAWLGAVAATLGDLLPGGDGARAGRALVLLGGGHFVLALPLARWLSRAPTPRELLLLSGLPLSLVLALVVALGPGPGTAYHGTRFLPDYFGQDAEGLEARQSERLEELAVLARDAGVRRLAGPVELLGRGDLALVELSPLDDAAQLAAVLETLRAGDRVDGAIVTGSTAGPPAGWSALAERGGPEDPPHLRLLRRDAP